MLWIFPLFAWIVNEPSASQPIPQPKDVVPATNGDFARDRVGAYALVLASQYHDDHLVVHLRPQRRHPRTHFRSH